MHWSAVWLYRLLLVSLLAFFLCLQVSAVSNPETCLDDGCGAFLRGDCCLDPDVRCLRSVFQWCGNFAAHAANISSREHPFVDCRTERDGRYIIRSHPCPLIGQAEPTNLSWVWANASTCNQTYLYTGDGNTFVFELATVRSCLRISYRGNALC